jgi:hypothetical protein
MPLRCGTLQPLHSLAAGLGHAARAVALALNTGDRGARSRGLVALPQTRFVIAWHVQHAGHGCGTAPRCAGRAGILEAFLMKLARIAAFDFSQDKNYLSG